MTVPADSLFHNSFMDTPISTGYCIVHRLPEWQLINSLCLVLFIFFFFLVITITKSPLRMTLIHSGPLGLVFLTALFALSPAKMLFFHQQPAVRVCLFKVLQYFQLFASKH